MKDFIDCELIATDAIVISKTYRVPCIEPGECATDGRCFWRLWHGLDARKYAIKVDDIDGVE